MPPALTSLPADRRTQDVLDALRRANAAFAQAFPGDPSERQPVHTVYGGAHLFHADTARKMGALARKSLEEHLPAPDDMAALFGWSFAFARTVYGRVKDKLEREPVEDFRIDFEDGYGNRPDAEEDGHAVTAAEEVARAHREGTLPAFIGIRIKPLSGELAPRSVRTLDVFVSTLLDRCGGKLPPGFVVTLPKVQLPEQVEALAALLGLIEAARGLAAGTLRLELMVETTQSVIGRDGAVALRRLVDAAGGRCTGAHFGTYDYTAGCNITAAYQHMGHPACDFAKHVMQVQLAGANVMLSDGATNVMPVGPHKAPGGGALTPEQARENREAVHRAWKVQYQNVRHSLECAYYQGWDLHPAQLPIRYAATYAFFLEGLEPASNRLRNFMEKAAQATLLGDVFDDAATGQGLLNFFLRGMSCGAITEEEALRTGLTLEELRTRSFVKILARRRNG